jgi:hypothetical protein
MHPTLYQWTPRASVWAVCCFITTCLNTFKETIRSPLAAAVVAAASPLCRVVSVSIWLTCYWTSLWCICGRPIASYPPRSMQTSWLVAPVSSWHCWLINTRLLTSADTNISCSYIYQLRRVCKVVQRLVEWWIHVETILTKRGTE